ncbi:unnamed protein product [Lampetra fluviatilis]
MTTPKGREIASREGKHERLPGWPPPALTPATAATPSVRTRSSRLVRVPKRYTDDECHAAPFKVARPVDGAAGRTTAADAAALHVASTMPIVSDRAGTGPAIAADASDSTSTSPTGHTSALRRLPQVHAFSATEGDWTAFHLRFKAAYRSIDWSEHEVLRALPTALDDDSMAAFYSIPEADRSSLAGACAAMAAIYEPPSTIQLRKRGDTESPLAFCSALLALGRAAYPSMDRAAFDSLAWNDY